jgi:DNA-binding transcriptional ArsR family regulator
MVLLLDHTNDPDPVAVRVVGSPVFEALTAHWAIVAEADDLDSFLERDRIERIVTRSALSEEDAAWMAQQHGTAWTFLVSHVDRSGATTVAGLVDYLEELEPGRLAADYTKQTHCGEKCDHPEPVDIEDPKVFEDRLLSVLRRIDRGAGGLLESLEPTLRHETQLTRFLQRRMDLERLIETVTNGIAYTTEAGVEEVVLVPSVTIRPWNLMFRFGGSRYFVYPASDEAVQADEDTPPSWMVQLFKAIGDEKRLRVLRKLGEGPQSLMELVEHLGLAKSTTHHHLRSLRAAGLVRQDVRGDKEESRYELRRDMLPEAMRLVGNYLAPDNKEQA